jgi:serine protease
MERRHRKPPTATLSAALALALGGLLLGTPAALASPPAVAASRDFAPHQLVVKFSGDRFGRALRLPAGVGVRAAAAALRRSPAVAYAAPNYIATASAQAGVAEVPDDPGNLGGAPQPPGAWVSRQWNFLPWEGIGSAALPVSAGGIDVVGAWGNLAAAGRPGGMGVTVAVLDTGVAYRALGSRFRRSPDFASAQFLDGYDFVEGDRVPLDLNGHGTHVAGTIAERTNNGIGLTGIAFRAKLMPVRVLDRAGRGAADDIARGIRFATAQGADVINMSFNFACGRAVPVVDEALREAYRRGAVTVASVGNLGSEGCVSPPATGPHAIGVGGTTEGGCLGDYSLAGQDVDLLAPGGGAPAPGCASVSTGPIYQVTLKGRNPRRFGEPGRYIGTSMAAAHVSGVAALTIASGVAGKRPTPDRVLRRLRATARDLGQPATRQGAGLIDAGGATEPST